MEYLRYSLVPKVTAYKELTQFKCEFAGLSLFWSGAKTRGFRIFEINKYLTRATASLVGLHNRKGRIAENYDADFVIWDPNAVIKVQESMIWHKNKVQG